ncbi:MAG: MFS transporter, partial [Bryobacteraceae bacterium]
MTRNTYQSTSFEPQPDRQMPDRAGGPTKIRWLLIFWIFLISAVAYIDRVNLSIAGQAIASDFHLSDIQLGWVFSAFVLGYALLQAPAGLLADRVGPRRTLAFAVIWWAIFTALITWLSPATAFIIPLLIAIRFTLGVGEAVMYPASNCIVSAWIPSRERGIANGIIFAGVGFGAGVTPPIITWVLLHYGWRASLWVSAFLGLIVGSIWYVIARDKPNNHPWVSSGEKQLIESGLPSRALNPSGSSRLSLSAVLKNTDVLAVTFSYFCYGYVAYIFFSWFFIYLSKVRGMNLRQSAYYTMLPFFAMAIASPLGGWLSDRIVLRYGPRWGRSALGAISLALTACFLALGTRVAAPEWASVVLAGGAASLYLSQSCYWSVSAEIGGESAGLVSGVMNMGCQLGGVLTASLTPALAQSYGWNTPFVVAAVLCLTGSLTWIPVQRKDK